MRITGIDADTKSIAMVTFFEEDNERKSLKVRYAQNKVAGRTAEDRFAGLIRSFVESQTEWLLSDWVYVEKPVYGVNAKATIAQSYIVGAIRSELILHKINHSLVDNTTWKKQIIGSGKASKEEIEMFARDILNLPEGLTQDLYDASCIAQFGMMASGRS